MAKKTRVVMSNGWVNIGVAIEDIKTGDMVMLNPALGRLAKSGVKPSKLRAAMTDIYCGDCDHRDWVPKHDCEARGIGVRHRR